mgnify:CR=1 FL=1
MTQKSPGGILEVVLLFGGKSAEHEVSIQSARNVAAAMRPDRYRVIPVYLSRGGEGYLVNREDLAAAGGGYRSLEPEGLSRSRPVRPAPREGRLGLLDAAGNGILEEGGCVYPVLHGPLGEDGTVQGMLRLFSVPFVGAGVLGSAVGMDKDVMKRLLREAGVPVPRFRVVRREEDPPSYRALAESLGPRLFVKPANMGSSVGIRTAEGREDLSRALEEAFEQLPSDPARCMPACFETLSAKDDAYALLGAAEYYHGRYKTGPQAAAGGRCKRVEALLRGARLDSLLSPANPPFLLGFEDFLVFVCHIRL